MQKRVQKSMAINRKVFREYVPESMQRVDSECLTTERSRDLDRSVSKLSLSDIVLSSLNNKDSCSIEQELVLDISRTEQPPHLGSDFSGSMKDAKCFLSQYYTVEPLAANPYSERASS